MAFFSRVWRAIRSHKLVFFLSVLVLLFPATYANERYKDWDNAQMIKGLARDFPELVTQIEEVTGLDLETKTDCMTSSEKYTRGVKTCELAYGLQTDDEVQIRKAFSVVESNDNFVKKEIGENEKGYRFSYRNKNGCSFVSKGSVYGSCIIGVREKNTDLASQLLK